ncbi:MAG TPA: biliverdin-producing heme oxygenase [Kofleriaceae bacterium]|nr:biliverdin-producing heme oxygenase [Kofleriaceae bacterium]
MWPSWILGHLAQQTHHHHASADGDRLAIMVRASDERYRAFLGQIYPFESAIEASCVATDGLDSRIRRTHLKASRLASDLDALGLATTELAPFDPPRFDGPAEALAWLWVLHRNTLLHGLISRYLAGKLPEVMRRAGSYLSVFEGRAGALMRELGDAIERVARRASIVERIVEVANEAFRAQRQWYRSNVLPERPRTPGSIAPPKAA